MADDDAPLMFDDIPSFDDMPESQGSEQRSQPMMFDDIPSFDDMPDHQEAPHKPAESTAGSMLREGIDEAAPSAGGMAGAYLGGQGGAALGTMAAPFMGPAAPAGPFIGGLAGALVGGFGGAAAIGKVQDVAKEVLGLDDSVQRAVNKEAHPYAVPAADIMTNVAGMRFDRGASVAARAVGAAAMGGVEAGSEAVQGGKWDPAAIAMNAAAGAVMTKPNALGQKIEGAADAAVNAAKKFIPGRPNAQANPNAAPPPATPPGTTNVSAAPGTAATPSPPNTTTNAGQVGQGNMGQTSGTSNNYSKLGSTPNATAKVTTDPGNGIDPAIAAATKSHEAKDVGWLTEDAGTPATPADMSAAGGKGPYGKLQPVQQQGAPPAAAPAQPAPPPTTPAPSQNKPAPNNAPVDPVQLAHDLGEQNGYLSPSYLQRRLAQAGVSLGYNDVHAIIDNLQKQGSLGAPTSAGRYPYVSRETGGQKSAGAPAATVTKQPENAVGFTDTTATGPNKDLSGNFKKLGDAPPARAVDNSSGTPTQNEAAGASAERSQQTPAPFKKLGGKTEVPERVTDLLERSKDETNHDATDAQKEAGNYKKAGGRVLGREFKVETAEGVTRKGVDPDTGEEWENTSPADYGYFKGTKGADSKPATKTSPAKVQGLDGYIVGTGNRHFVVDQRNLKTGKFDEHKVIARVSGPEEAAHVYKRGFSDGKGEERMGAITEITEPEFKGWASKGWLRKPYSKDWKDTAPAGPPRDTSPLVAAEPKAKKSRAAQEAPEVTAEEHAPDREARLISAAKELLAQHERLGDSDRARLDHVHGLLKDARDALETGHEFVADAHMRDAEAALKEENKGQKKTNNLEIEGVVTADGNAATANTVVKARENSAKVKKINAAYDEIKAHPELDNKKIEASITNPKLRAPILAALRKYLATIRGGYRPKNNDAVTLERIVKRYNETKAGDDVASGRGNIEGEYSPEEMSQSLTSKEQEYRDMMTDFIMLRHGGEPAKEVRQRYRIADDTDLDMRRANANAEELPDQVHPVSEENAHEGSEEATEPTYKPLSHKEEGTKKTGRVLQRTEPARQVPKEKPTIDLKRNGEEGGAQLGEALGVKDAAPKKPVWEQVTTKAPKREADTGAKADPATVKAINEQLKAGKITLADLNKPGVIRRFLADQQGHLDVDAIWNAIKSAGMGVRRLERAVGRKYEAIVGKRSESSGYRANPIFKGDRTPQQEYAASVHDLLHQANNDRTSHVIDLLERGNDAADDITKTMDKRIFELRDEKKMQHATAKEQQEFDRHLKPVLDENDAMYKRAVALGADVGPKVMDHISHIPEGALDLGPKEDPVTGTVSGLSTAAKGAAVARHFVALENDASGKRHVIGINEDGYTVYRNHQARRVVDPNFSYEPGKKLTIVDNNGQAHKFTMGDATVAEKEAHANFEGNKPAKYYKSAILSALAANYHLGEMVRNLELVDKLKKSPEFLRNATTSKNAPSNYIETDHPNFQGWKMEPALAHVMDQYAKPGVDALDGYRKFAQAITKTIFWNPIPHMGNVLAHWAVEKGFDWLKPTGWHSIAVDGAKAIKSVITQDNLQKRIADSGGSLIYRGIVSQQGMQQVARKVGIDIKENPGKWRAIADKFGLGLPDLADAIYKGSSRAMWAVNDMLMTQAVLQKQRQTGGRMSVEQAIKEVERHIPNYRLPSDVLGSRNFTKFLEDPGAISFGRYHYGMLNSFANIAGDLVHGNAADKIHAVGNVLAMAVGAYVIYPALDKAWQGLTGNDKAEARRRGPFALMHTIGEAADSTKDPLNAVQNVTTLNPLLNTILKTYENRDYRGHSIIDRGTFANAAHGSPDDAIRLAGQVGGHAATNLISPLGTIANAVQAGHGPGATLRDQLLDIKDPSDAAKKYETQAAQKARQETKTRTNHPSNFIEKAVNSLTGR